MNRPRLTIKYNPETDRLEGSTDGDEPRQVSVDWHHRITLEEFRTLQVAMYVMVGGGLLGQMYAESPADAYLDPRAGRRPYREDEIETVRQILLACCHALGLDPQHAPRMPELKGCWVF